MANTIKFQDVQKSIKTLPVWQTKPELFVIEDGRTNCNFKVIDRDSTFFARFGIDLPHHFIFRKNEALAAKTASNAGICPELKYSQDGFLVTDFIQGKGLAIKDGADQNTVSKIALLLKKLHATDTSNIRNTFNVSEVVRSYIECMGDKLDVSTRKLIEKILLKSPELEPCSLIHGDLIPNNFIFDNERLWLIDWEYAGLGHPAIDLAMIITNFELNDEQGRFLVETHGLCTFEQVELQKPLLIAREAMWTIVQIDKVGLEGDLEEYLGICLKRLEEYT